MAGEEARITLTTRDAHGNRQLFGGPPSGAWAVRLAGPAALAATLRQLDGGVWEGRYMPTAAGEYALHVTLNGEHARGSPSAVTVRPGPAEPRRCVVEGLWTGPLQLGETAFFHVRPSDAHGNPTSLQGARWNARVRPPLTSSATPTVRLHGKADGTCEGRFTPEARGRHVVTVLLSGSSTRVGELPLDVL